MLFDVVKKEVMLMLKEERNYKSEILEMWDYEEGSDEYNTGLKNLNKYSDAELKNLSIIGLTNIVKGNLTGKII